MHRARAEEQVLRAEHEPCRGQMIEGMHDPADARTRLRRYFFEGKNFAFGFDACAAVLGNLEIVVVERVFRLLRTPRAALRTPDAGVGRARPRGARAVRRVLLGRRAATDRERGLEELMPAPELFGNL